MNIKRIFCILFTLLFSVCVSAAPKKLIQESLIPRLFEPLPRTSIVTCGYIENMDNRFFVIRSTDIRLFSGELEENIMEGLITGCLRRNHGRQLIATLPELSQDIGHDEITCSKNKTPGFPVTFMASSSNWQYLHPARIQACFEKLEKNNDPPVKQLQSTPSVELPV